ncbi:MAG: hypothetical protein ACP5RF_03180 [Candidatus Micrarchaeia archaeon]
MRSLNYIFILIGVLSIMGVSSASMANVYSLLSSYNVPSSIQNMLSPINIYYSGNNYTALYSSNALYFLVNDTSDSFVMNATQIYIIIRNETIANSYMTISKPQLISYMSSYINSTASSMNECLFETGLNQYTCTLSNSCYSCQTVPSCNILLYKTDGYTGPFGQAVASLEQQYNTLNSSLSQFYSSIESLNASNAAYKLSIADSAFRNISNITTSIYKNPLFPPSSNITNSQKLQCNFYSNPSTAPWYCNSFGYCSALTYNYSMLNKLSSVMAQINSRPFLESQIYMLAYNASNTESKYIEPIFYARKIAQLDSITHVTLANYSTLVNSTELVLSHISNSTAQSILAKLQNQINYTENNFLSLNLTKENTTLINYMQNLSKVYYKINATYSSLLLLARNNTAMLLKDQLNSRNAVPAIAPLAMSQFEINSELESYIPNASSVNESLHLLSSKISAMYYAPISIDEFVRAVDGSFARSLSRFIPMPYQSNIMLAPIYSSLLSLLIGIILFGIIFFMYLQMKLKRRIVINRRTSKNWHIFFGIIWLFIIAYVLLTYIFAASASSFAPISAIDNAVAHSNFVVVMLNGTPTLSQYECGSLVSKAAIAMHKTPIIASLKGSSCAVGNTTSTYDTCMNYYAQHNIPVVMLSNSNSSSITSYSFYGTVLYAQGNESFMDSCYASLLLK